MNHPTIHHQVLEPVTASVQALVQAWAATPGAAAAQPSPAQEALTQCAQRLADAYARAAPGSQQRQDFRTLYDAVQAALDVLARLDR